MEFTKNDYRLLISINEKLTDICEEIRQINKNLSKKVDNDEEYKDLKIKVNSLWELRTKIIGMLIGSSLGGGLIASILDNIVRNVFAR